MEPLSNLDLYILTSVVATLFMVFIVGTYRQLSKAEKEGYKYDPNEKKYGREALFMLAAKMFEEEGISVKKNKKQKALRSKPTRGTIADMDNGGVRFPEREVDVDEDMPGEWVKYVEKRVRDTNTNT